MQSVRPVVAAMVVVGALMACGQPSPEIAASSTLMMPLGSPCTAEGGGGTSYTSEVATLKVSIAAADLAEPMIHQGEENDGVEKASVEKVPVGENRTIGVFGMVSGSPLWRAVATGVSVKKDEDTRIDVLLARVADFTCARRPDVNARIFHTATTLKDGRILFVGGAATSVADTATCPDCRRFVGTNSAAVYDPRTGTISASGSMSSARVGHVAVLLDDGRVAVAGGASELIHHPIDAQTKFPLVPPAGTVLSTVEVWDPAGGGFSAATCSPACPGRLFAAATSTRDGEMIVTGGIPADIKNQGWAALRRLGQRHSPRAKRPGRISARALGWQHRVPVARRRRHDGRAERLLFGRGAIHAVPGVAGRRPPSKCGR
jgi:hypothetical protein